MPDELSDRGVVLVTGATGFIGRHLQTHLLDAGYRLRVLVRPGSPRMDQVDGRASRIEGSLDDRALLEGALAGCSAAVHCAGAVRGHSYQDFAGVNVDAVRTLAGAIASLANKPPLLHVSSITATAPELSNYAASKRAGERVLEEFPRLNWTIFRPPAVYGPGDVEMRPLLQLVRYGIVLMPGGNRGQRLSLLHVDDLCRAVLAWLLAPARHQHVCYELDDGRDDGYSYQDIAAAVCMSPLFGAPINLPLPAGLLNMLAWLNEPLTKLTGRAPMVTRGKVRELTHPRWLCNNAPFCASSGWQPEIQLAEGAQALFGS